MRELVNKSTSIEERTNAFGEEAVKLIGEIAALEQTSVTPSVKRTADDLSKTFIAPVADGRDASLQERQTTVVGRVEKAVAAQSKALAAAADEILNREKAVPPRFQPLSPPEAVLAYAGNFLPSWAGAISIDLLPAVLIFIMIIVEGAIRKQGGGDLDAETMSAADVMRAVQLYRQMHGSVWGPDGPDHPDQPRGTSKPAADASVRETSAHDTDTPRMSPPQPVPPGRPVSDRLTGHDRSPRRRASRSATAAGIGSRGTDPSSGVLAAAQRRRHHRRARLLRALPAGRSASAGRDDATRSRRHGAGEATGPCETLPPARDTETAAQHRPGPAGLQHAASDQAVGDRMHFIRGPKGAASAVGRIEPGTADALAQFIEQQGGDQTLYLHSPGGFVQDALRMSKLLRAKHIDTAVSNDAYCASSCPIVFAGGKERTAGARSWIGVHQIFALDDGDRDNAEVMADAQTVSAQVQDLLVAMGVDPRAWLPAMKTPSAQIYIFTTEELTAYKLATRIEPSTQR